MFAGNLFPIVWNFRYICTIMSKFHEFTNCTFDTQNVVKQRAATRHKWIFNLFIKYNFNKKETLTSDKSI